MSARKKILLLCIIATGSLPLIAISENTLSELPFSNHSLTQDAIARQLGWIPSGENHCGGYYLEQPFVYPIEPPNGNMIETTGQQGLISFHGTSIIEGKVTVNRAGQQITSNKAYLYRDPTTGKINVIELIGDVHLREPNTLIIGKQGRYNFKTNAKELTDVLYRTSLLNSKQIAGPNSVTPADRQQMRKITGLTAWGKADEFYQDEPKIYQLAKASYSTCLPNDPAWRVKSSHIVLNKETGRGYATHARILVKEVPVFYTPYINFPIDSRRQTGFLWPKFGVSNKFGPYIRPPFYWNMAPNYDMTITPSLLSKRGIQLSDNFRYLTEKSSGNIEVVALPGDKFFAEFQRSSEEKYGSSTDPVTQAELNRLVNASTTRKSFLWRNASIYNEHWSSGVDFNYASDDYYLQDFGSNLNESTQNQLLQQGELLYKGENWNFTGRVQAYQTLHPIIENQAPTENQYRRLPQLVFNGDYPDQALGLEYFINNEITNFDILKTPGKDELQPIGNRINTQPGISLPLYWPYFYINPRIQLALTDYNLRQTTDTDTNGSIQRSVPIFDVVSGVSLNRNLNLFGNAFQQTLEPKVYYTYVPYRNQENIPIFDTNVNTLTYQQVFNYNRFTGIDRIGDANQVGVGVTTRLIDQETGLEKVRIGVGNIIYFADRRVTLCNDTSCSDNPDNPANHWRLSPVTGELSYHVDPLWTLSGNSLWNPISKQIDNSSIALSYHPDTARVFNLAYSFARNGDPFSGIGTNTNDNDLKLTDMSFSWPVIRDISAVGRWSHDWNTNHFQNLVYGLQYDTCCWAVRAVGGRTFVGPDPTDNTKLLYDSDFYIEFALKGLGNAGTGDPTALLNSVAGYTSAFGQENVR